MGGDQEWTHKGTVCSKCVLIIKSGMICLQNKTPIYNLAAGKCLGAKSKESGAVVTMKLCTDPDKNTWDLIR